MEGSTFHHVVETGGRESSLFELGTEALEWFSQCLGDDDGLRLFSHLNVDLGRGGVGWIGRKSEISDGC